jgi:predicted AAA+ superfamily ATPase
VIDEAQRTPELVLAVKQIFDRDRTFGQFLLTGSADLVTARIVADALRDM